MEDLRITRLVLNDIGVFKNLDLNFQKNQPKDKAEIHIFTGENGTGKTTLLEALTYFDFVFNEELKNLNKDKKRYDLLSQKGGFFKGNNIELYFNQRNISFNVFGKNKVKDAPFFENYYTPISFLSKNHSYTFFAYSGYRQVQSTKVDVLKDFTFNPITEALTFDKTNLNSDLFQWIANNKTRAALSFQKGNKLGSRLYLSSISKIELAISEIINRKVEFVIDERTLNVMIKLDDKSVNYNTLADGYKSIISWLTDLMFRLDYMPTEGKENFTLFLDEIDVHLHPAAQRRILPVIQKLFPKAQIFLTTHSPFVIGSVDDSWVYKFKLDENGNSILDGEPFITEDGKSYRYILDQVFDVKTQFGIEFEKQLTAFYLKRDELIKAQLNLALLAEYAKAAGDLALQSEELNAIISNETRQLSRILNKEISLSL